MSTEGTSNGKIPLLRRVQLVSRGHYYRRLAPRRHTTRRTTPMLALDPWVLGLTGYERVVVVAGGPTALDIPRDPSSLHVATNLSEDVVADLPYVNFLSEANRVARYLKRGPASEQCLGTLLRIEVGKRTPDRISLASWTIDQCRRFERATPDVVASEFFDQGVERENFDLFSSRITAQLGMPVYQYNSGFGAAYFGYFLAATLQIPLDLYGLDAGASGLTHFDGTPQGSPSVVGDQVRTRLTTLLTRMHRQTSVEVTNHSAFRPDVTAGEH